MINRVTVSFTMLVCFLAAGSTAVLAFDPGTGKQPPSPGHGNAQEVVLNGKQITGVSVNGTTIGRDRILLEMNALMKSRAILHGGAMFSLGQFTDQAIDKLVKRELLAQRAASGGYAVSPAELEDAWAEEKGRWGDSPEAFAKSLEVRGGISEAYLKERIREDILVGKMVDAEVYPAIDLSEKALRRYYEGNAALFESGTPMLRYIHISREPVEGLSGPERRSKVYDMLKKGGTSFGELARMYSDHATADNDGALGDSPAEPPPFFESGKGLRPSQFSIPHRDDSGWHIYFRDAKSTTVRPFAEVRDEVHDRLEQEGRRATLEAFIGELVSAASITLLE